jgi:hypothetical protein
VTGFPASSATTVSETTLLALHLLKIGGKPGRAVWWALRAHQGRLRGQADSEFEIRAATPKKAIPIIDFYMPRKAITKKTAYLASP